VLRRIEVDIGADAVDAEVTSALLLELVPGGLELVDGPAGRTLVAYADADEEAAIHTAFPKARSSAVKPGWEDGWRAWHRPVVAGGLWIGPPWLEPEAGRPAVVIDPGRAFGTGAHPTTRICVELLAGLERGSLLDVGCGSGVLSIAGGRLGFGPLLAVDSDSVAVEATVANAAANAIDLRACVVDGLVDPLPATHVAVANILLAPVAQVLMRVDAQAVVTSGYLAGERPSASGWREDRRLELDGWAGHVFRRPASV
jgi:ribosomal protein L11 methyltransferase